MSKAEKQPESETSAAATGVRVCIVTPYEPAPTETFIRAHVERLPARVTLAYGWPLMVGGRPVLPAARRLYHKALRKLLGRGVERESTEAYMTAFRRAGADLVLAEYGDVGAQVTEACRRLRVPLIVHFHGYDASVREVLEAHREAYPVMFREAAAVVAVSRAMQRNLLALGAPAEKVHYNPYGIDCDRFGGADPAAAPPVFLSVGRFVEKKAPQLMLEAFAEVQRDCPDARLRMVGDGPLFEECRSLAARLELGGAVEFLGPRPHDVVQAEMRAARCFVQHSVEAPNGDCEGTPVAVLEAGASGLPVVATRHAGIPDVVVEGETGFLIDERDVRGMAAHMLRLTRDPALAGRMGVSARRHIAANFTKEQSDRKLWAVIEACVGRRGGSSSLA